MELELKPIISKEEIVSNSTSSNNYCNSECAVAIAKNAIQVMPELKVGSRNAVLGVDLCLICNSEIDSSPKKNGKFPVDQLDDLLKVFKISKSAFEGLTSGSIVPSKLLCASCGKHIKEALDILLNIEYLQKNFKVLTKILTGILKNTWDDKADDGSSCVYRIRKTLVQCFSNCKVTIKGPRLKVTAARRGKKNVSKKSEGIILELAQRTSGKRQRFQRDGRAREKKISSCLPKDDYYYDTIQPESNLEEVSFVDEVSDCDYVPCAREEKNGVTSGGSFQPENSEFGKLKKIKSANRDYDDKGKIVSFVCSYCNRRMSRQDYATEEGGYVFKCFPDCCDRVMNKFSNLVIHHAASCPSKPKSPRSARPYVDIKKVLDPVDTPNFSDIKLGLKHNDRNVVIGFECSVCRKEMTPSDYETGSGKYLFKCKFDPCNTVTKTFYNMAYHHYSHCTGRPLNKPRWKSSHRKTGTGGEQTITSESASGELGTESEVVGRKYDNRGRIVSFECSSCQKKMTRADFVDQATNTYIYKCSPKCCTKIFSTFVNLIFHHESRCEPEYYPPGTDPPDCPQETVMRKKPRKQNRVYAPLASFECMHCHREYRKHEFAKDVSGKFTFNCDLLDCHKSYDSFPIFRRHHEATCPEKPSDIHQCEHCGKSCYSAQLLKNHIASLHTGEFKYFCEKCGIGVVSTHALRRHMLIHVSERKFRCSHCPASFKRKDHILKHERRHKGVPAFVCDSCGKTFVNREGLRQHEVNFHGQGEFVCTSCQKVFKSSSYLKYHIWATHKGMRKNSSRRGHKLKGEELEVEVIEAMEVEAVEDPKTYKERTIDDSDGPTIMAVNSLLSITSEDVEYI